ncbi:Polyketide synthase-nonribosomal peptide synthetase, partial [Tolypocladium ophioglossoides CBS 100239]
CCLPGDVNSASEFWDDEQGQRKHAQSPCLQFNIDAHYHKNNNRPGSFSVLGGYFLNGSLIATVQLLDSWGVRPVVTVGHSSGEMAAAYAAGFVSTNDSIIAAYYRDCPGCRHRGRHDGCWSRIRGRLALPGRCREQGRRSCHNSPSLVTLSGDADVIEMVETKLDAASVFVCPVKTNSKAYHSHHMAAMVNKGRSALCHGRAYQADQSGAQGRQDRLCSHVAQRHRLRRPAPQGRWRAVPAQLPRNMDKATHSYVEESFALPDHKPVRGATIVGLPSYQWNYTRPFWAEARASSEHHDPKFPRHDILGSRPAVAQGPPSWRRVFVFPAAGYFAMAIKAIRQLNESSPVLVHVEYYVLRDVPIKTALVTPNDDDGIEVTFNIRPSVYGHGWWDWSVSSLDSEGVENTTCLAALASISAHTGRRRGRFLSPLSAPLARRGTKHCVRLVSTTGWPFKTWTTMACGEHCKGLFGKIKMVQPPV